jgi:hypothetical protein
VEKYEWERIVVGTQPHPRAFKRNGSYVRTAKVVVDRRGSHARSFSAFVCGGVENMIILKSGDSEFKGYVRHRGYYNRFSVSANAHMSQVHQGPIHHAEGVERPRHGNRDVGHVARDER